MKHHPVIALLAVLVCSFKANAEGKLDFEGTAVDAGKPVGGLAVTLYVDNKKSKSTQTDASGTFRFELAYDQQYRIIISGEKYVNTTIEINSRVPQKEKSYTLSYSVTFDVFPQKKGHKAVLSRPAMIHVSYVPAKQHFGMREPYENSVNYEKIPENEKTVFKDKDIGKEKGNFPETVKEVKDEAELEYIKNNEEKTKHAGFQKDIAESAAAEATAVESSGKAIERRARSLEDKRGKESEAKALREELAKEQDKAEESATDNRKKRAAAQQKLMAEIAEMIKTEKQQSKP